MVLLKRTMEKNWIKNIKRLMDQQKKKTLGIHDHKDKIDQLALEFEEDEA